jgi:polyisoprenoid-binding protein YceI
MSTCGHADVSVLARFVAVALAAGTFAGVAGAEAQRYGVRLSADGITLEVPYTLGTHRERVTAVDGYLMLDPRSLELVRGRLTVPVNAIRSEDRTRECHLREALGLDYRRSRYPREHVCDPDDRLPTSGDDAIAFPHVTLELMAGGPIAGPAAPEHGGAVGVEARALWTIHGVTRPALLRLSVAREAAPDGRFRVSGRHDLRLSDFGVEVKSAKVLFVSISVKDEVVLRLDAVLEPARPGLPDHAGVESPRAQPPPR